MPSFGGINIFGRSSRFMTSNNPSEAQVNHFFGTNGVERLHGGLTGRITMVSGVLAANSSANLAIVREAFRSYDDGIDRLLVDNLGVGWPNVVLESFEPGDRVLRDAGGFYLTYRATFRHLS